jgi:hypothetical protein
VPEPDEPPPQAMRNVDNKQRQTIPSDARVKGFRTKAETLDEQQTCEERRCILENSLDPISRAHTVYSLCDGLVT